MTVAGFVVATCAVVVSVLAAYLSWRQTRATESQSRTALVALQRDSERAGSDAEPPTRLTVELVQRPALVDSRRRTRLSSIQLTNHGPASLRGVALRVVRTPDGESGHPAPVQLNHGQPDLGTLVAGESRRVPVAVSDPADWVYDRLYLQVECRLDGDRRWATVLPFRIHSPHLSPVRRTRVPSPSGPGGAGARSRTAALLAAAAALVVAVLVAYALRR